MFPFNSGASGPDRGVHVISFYKVSTLPWCQKNTVAAEDLHQRSVPLWFIPTMQLYTGNELCIPKLNGSPAEERLNGSFAIDTRENLSAETTTKAEVRFGLEIDGFFTVLSKKYTWHD